MGGNKPFVTNLVTNGDKSIHCTLLKLKLQIHFDISCGRGECVTRYCCLQSFCVYCQRECDESMTMMVSLMMMMTWMAFSRWWQYDDECDDENHEDFDEDNDDNDDDDGLCSHFGSIAGRNVMLQWCWWFGWWWRWHWWWWWWWSRLQPFWVYCQQECDEGLGRASLSPSYTVMTARHTNPTWPPNKLPTM